MVALDVSEPGVVFWGNGTPSVVLEVGSSRQRALFDVAKSSPTVLVFQHTLVAGAADLDGIALVPSSLSVPRSGAFRCSLVSSAGRDFVNANHPGIAPSQNHTVLPVVPTEIQGKTGMLTLR